MLEHHFLEMAAESLPTRHHEMLAQAERERRWAAGTERPARWQKRVLVALGARLIAMGRRLVGAGAGHTAPVRIEV